MKVKKQHLLDKDKYICSCGQFAFKNRSKSICNERKYMIVKEEWELP